MDQSLTERQIDCLRILQKAGAISPGLAEAAFRIGPAFTGASADVLRRRGYVGRTDSAGGRRRYWLTDLGADYLHRRGM